MGEPSWISPSSGLIGLVLSSAAMDRELGRPYGARASFLHREIVALRRHWPPTGCLFNTRLDETMAQCKAAQLNMKLLALDCELAFFAGIVARGEAMFQRYFDLLWTGRTFARH